MTRKAGPRIVAAELTGESEITVMNALADAGREGLLCGELIAALAAAGSAAPSRRASQVLGCLKDWGRVRCRMEGRTARCWARDSAPAGDGEGHGKNRLGADTRRGMPNGGTSVYRRNGPNQGQATPRGDALRVCCALADSAEEDRGRPNSLAPFRPAIPALARRARRQVCCVAGLSVEAAREQGVSGEQVPQFAKLRLYSEGTT